MRLVKLKTITDIQVGYQSRRGIKDNIKGTHRLIQGKDFDKNSTLQTERLISFFPEGKYKLYELKKEDILFQSRGVKNIAYHIDRNLKNTLAAGSFYILRLKTDKILPAYLAWWINQKYTQSVIQAQAGGTWISFISKKVLEELEVKIPQLHKQKKIEKVNELLQKEEKLKKKLSELRSQMVKAVCLKSIR